MGIGVEVPRLAEVVGYGAGRIPLGVGGVVEAHGQVDLNQLQKHIIKVVMVYY